MKILLIALYFVATYADDCEMHSAVSGPGCPAIIDTGECCGAPPEGTNDGQCMVVACPTTEAPATTQGATEPATTCICPTYPAITPAPIISGGGSKGSKHAAGSGTGSCDCEQGVAELRYVYLGTRSSVKIEIFTGKSDPAPRICLFENVQPSQEVVCDLRGNSPGLVATGYVKFATESPFVITYSDGSTCAAQYHTSCSSDIVGVIQPECTELVVSGWRDNLNYASGLDCDDGIVPCDCGNIVVEEEEPEPEPEFVDIIVGEKCYCDYTGRPATAATTTSTAAPKSGKKSKKGKSKGGKGGGGLGVGDCDCEGGQMTLTLMYQGTQQVDIEFFYKDGTLMCINNGVNEGEEVTCNTQTPTAPGAPIYEKLGTNTYVRLKDQNGNEVCQTAIHTSCSQDIVGTYGDEECGTDLIVSGWIDKANLIDGLGCDDGYVPCDCDGTFVEEQPDPVEEPITNIGEDVCYCSTVDRSALTSTTTAAPGGKSKGGKSKNRDNGYGWGDCDCSGGVYMLRFVYKGAVSPVDITLFYDGLDSEVICSRENVAYGEENQCELSVDGPLDSVTGDALYFKLQKETYVRVTDPSGSNPNCEGSWHTSCSKDIVGWTAVGCEDVIISGWSGNDNTAECDDGFQPCPDGCNDCSIYSIEPSDFYEGQNECEMQDGCYIDQATNTCKSDQAGFFVGNNANKQSIIFAVVAAIAVVSLIF